MKPYIYPYKNGLRSALALREETGWPRISLDKSKFKASKDKVVINWGCSNIDNGEVRKCNIINSPEAVAVATNKLHFFQACSKAGVSTPSWTGEVGIAKDWARAGRTVVARTMLRGSGGAGIVICESVEDVPPAELYTIYVPKKSEWRVHLTSRGVFDVQRKARRKDFPEDRINWRVRNLEGGFIYAREGNEDVPRCVVNVAREALAATGLDFGAVDVIYNERHDRAFVLEINTAPGLEGATVGNYSRALTSYIEETFGAPF